MSDKPTMMQTMAVKLTAEMRKDPRLQHIPPERLQAKSAGTVLGYLFVGLGVLLLFASLAGIGALVYLDKLKDAGWILLAFLFGVPAMAVCILVVGAVQLSKDFIDTLGWFTTFLRTVVAIFRRTNGASGAP